MPVNYESTPSNKARQHSLTCFLNSLLREWTDNSVVVESKPSQVVVQLAEDESLVIPLQKYSELGRHCYTGEIRLKRNDEEIEISFEDLVAKMARHLAAKLNADSESLATFEARVANSLENMELALASSRERIEALYQSKLNFIDSEQGLVIGHNFHPIPKSKSEFNEEDSQLYSPEMGGRFPLLWLNAAPEILHSKNAASFAERQWTQELLELDQPKVDSASNAQSQKFTAVPMHPWQWKVLAKNPTIQKYIEAGQLIVLGEGEKLWYPTSSLRSVYQPESPYMLKFSITLKLTNSVRHLLAHEVERGLQLQDVLTTQAGREFLASHPRFHVLGEPAYICFKNVDGSPMSESIVVCRENPFTADNGADKAVLATLTQDHPLGGQNLIQKLISQLPDGATELRKNSRIWFERYLEIALKPLLLAQANYGITLGAHQQNLILEIIEGLPSQAYFRDCQGTGYSELGFKLFADDVPLLDRANGNILTPRMGNWLFSYYAILNSTFNVITAIAADDWISEEELLTDMAVFLENLRASGVRDSACLDFLLSDEHLMHKGNFLCSLTNLNENTTRDPLALYTPVENSIAKYLKAASVSASGTEVDV